jgi:hypothetical protein
MSGVELPRRGVHVAHDKPVLPKRIRPVVADRNATGQAPRYDGSRRLATVLAHEIEGNAAILILLQTLAGRQIGMGTKIDWDALFCYTVGVASKPTWQELLRR